MRIVRGRERRYLLLVALLDAGRPLSLAELEAALAERDALVLGRPAKTISDALRGDVRRGRVVRAGRGRYAVGHIARSSAQWFRDGAEAMAPEAARPVDRESIDQRAMRRRSELAAGTLGDDAGAA